MVTASRFAAFPLASFISLVLLVASVMAQQDPRDKGCIPSANSTFVDGHGTAHVTRIVPVPATVSLAAQKLIGSNFANSAAPPPSLEEGRAIANATEKRLAAQALAIFPATVHSAVIAGVPVRIIRPAIIPRNKAGRVLINLHGGGFVADWGSLTETIPIASLAGTEVISVLYRLAPEHPFPAAVDDAVTVYREVLKTHKPAQIAIYGTSAGAILTAEVTSKLRQLGLPLPGALGIFSGSGDLSQRGDSYSLFSVTGLAGPIESTDEPPFPAYVANTDRRNPILSPLYGDLRGFPPTLFLSSTRDMLLSDTAILNRAFLRAGVDTQFVVFEALQHGFWNDPQLPESREADRVIAHFFDTHLTR